MTPEPERKTYHFPGTIWKTLADPARGILFLEIRNAGERTVSFAALRLTDHFWLFKDLSFDEPWWISLTAVEQDILLFTTYDDTSNPDKKSIIAYDMARQKIVWWRSGFTFSAVRPGQVIGLDKKFLWKEVVLDIVRGEEVQEVAPDLETKQNFHVIRPFQYQAGSEAFETVRNFLMTTCQLTSPVAIEYREFEPYIIISVFVQEEELANFLYVFTTSGQKVLNERLGEQLSGIGVDTFFILNGCLIFVKNKNELVSYKLV